MRTFLLRDAVALVDKGGDTYCRRLDRTVALARQHGMGIEVTLSEHVLFDVQRTAYLLDSVLLFSEVTVHLHTSQNNRFGKNIFTDTFLLRLNKFLGQAGHHIIGVCIHPDLVDDYTFVRQMHLDGAFFAVEVLDATASHGNRFDQIDSILQLNDHVDLLLDTAHIWEMQWMGQPGLLSYYRRFKERIKEIHISQPGNHYDSSKMDEGFDTNHSLLHFNHHGGEGLVLIVEALPDVNLVVEGVIPAGGYGQGLLEREIQYLKRMINCELGEYYT
eukprot:TRINITY_DN12200_c0_g1_i1.p2 TRINITY_DN12200_c0_g1~~TRINITY_DN12200_c0_g1_i1.p2  ORF type:complete len:274 (+),score=15.87 TRINITY_DN12200_c0_g1_i1:193-1014(+)